MEGRIYGTLQKLYHQTSHATKFGCPRGQQGLLSAAPQLRGLYLVLTRGHAAGWTQQSLESTSATRGPSSSGVSGSQNLGSAHPVSQVPNPRPSLAAVQSAGATNTSTAGAILQDLSAEDHQSSTAATAGGASAPPPPSVWWRALKVTLGLSLAAATTSCAYVTYRCDLETVEQSLKSFRDDLARTTASPPSVDGSNSILELGPKKLYEAAAFAALGAGELYIDGRRRAEEQLDEWSRPSSDRLLPDLQPNEQHVYTLVLDLNDTIVHSDWKRDRGWRTFKRPGVEPFLERMAQFYEIVVFSDQLNITVDPILDRLDKKGCIKYRLYRDGTQYTRGHFYRDFTKLNRDPSRVVYISADPKSCLQIENLLALKPWKLEPDDTSLLDHLPFLEFLARNRPPDVRAVLKSYEGKDVPSTFRERAKQVQRHIQERKRQSFLGLGTFGRSAGS